MPILIVANSVINPNEIELRGVLLKNKKDRIAIKQQLRTRGMRIAKLK